MDVSKHVEHWRDGARQDWEVGSDLVRRGRSRHGLFFVHLALEKALKALVCRATDSVPPRLHDLLRLATTARLEISEQQREVLAEVNSFNLAGRYPEAIGPLPSRGQALRLLEEAGGILQWLFSQ